MLLYFRPFICDSNVYSIDKVRTSFKLCHDVDVIKVCDFLNSFMPQYRSSFASYKYNHLFTFGIKGFSFTVGLSLNDPQDVESVRKGFIEFNPNKILGDIYLKDGFVKSVVSPFMSDEELVKQEVLNEKRIRLCDVFYQIHGYLHGLAKCWEVQRFDFAVDVQILRSQVQVCKDRRAYSCFRKSVDDLTEYLGSRSSAGAVKIYNKTLESDLDFDCTRIELTLDSKDYANMCKSFPEVYIRESHTPATEILIELLQMLPVEERDMYLARLNYRTRLKVKAEMFESPFTVPEHCWDAVMSVLEMFE